MRQPIAIESSGFFGELITLMVRAIGPPHRRVARRLVLVVVRRASQRQAIAQCQTRFVQRNAASRLLDLLDEVLQVGRQAVELAGALGRSNAVLAAPLAQQVVQLVVDAEDLLQEVVGDLLWGGDAIDPPLKLESRASRDGYGEA